MKPFNKSDRLFLIFFVFLSIMISMVLARGDKTFPRVIDTTPKSENISPGTRQIILEFNRDMNEASVEKNFRIEPAIKGKFSWVGRKVAYSFTEPLSPGQEMTINLSGASDRLGVLMKQDYIKKYRISSQHLYFIGAENNEKNRLIRTQLTSGKIEALSTPTIIVKDYRIQANEKMAFLLGREERQGSEESINDLYSLDLMSGKTDKLIDGKKERIMSMTIAPDGSILLVRKGELNKLDDYSSMVDPGHLWIYDLKSKKWSKFWNTELYGNEFYFSPDSKYLVGRMIYGDITIVSIENDPENTVYLENYAGSYTLSPIGSSLAFVDFEDPFSSQNLLLRANDGSTKTLLSDKGQILFPAFNNKGDRLFFLLSKTESNFTETGFMQLNPYHLYYYDLKNNELKALTENNDFFEGFFSISSDGFKIAMERYETQEGVPFFDSQLDKENPSAHLWIYDTASKTLQDLKLKGTRPFMN